MIDPSTGQQVPDEGQNAGNLTLPQDPTQLQGAIRDQQQREMAQMPSSLARRSMGSQLGVQQALGGDPRVQQAQQQQAQLKGVIAQVQRDAPDNEDPIAAQ